MSRSTLEVRAYAVMVLVLACSQAAPAQPAPPAPGPGSTYAALQPAQQRLVEDWFARFSAVVAKPVDPVEGYEALPLSTRTTFNAVTHALLRTTLTDASGTSLGDSAIALVGRLDTVAGEVLGARGDRQFRIYVQMKPGALEVLPRAREFYRAHDNTVYHQGYPINFRTSGTPSIQISLSRDGSRADIDVDYRSSRFPMALVNGHLTASNSDIRVGNNDARHNDQWTGLSNWWRNLLGLPFLERSAPTSVQAIAAGATRPADKAADAVYDFLNSWLVDQKPDQSIGYFAAQALACAEVEGNATADHGMARFALLRRMIAANAELGKVGALRDISVGVAITSARAKVIKQPHHAQFVLYDVREDLAEEIKCVNRLDSAQASGKALKSRAFGKYVGASFTIKGKHDAGRMVATLWEKDRGYWRMISYDVDPEFERSRAPDVGAPMTAAPLEIVAGDTAMSQAASRFLNEWLVRKDVDQAIESVASQALACVAVYRADGVPPPGTAEESRALLKQGMAATAAAVGAVRNLADAIVPPAVHHTALKLVKHKDGAAFAIASIPDSMGDATDCGRRGPDGDPQFNTVPVPAAYGNYYASGFALNTGTAGPATLWIVWSKVDGSWKATSYVLLTP